MPRSTEKPASYQDLFDLPEHMVGQIIHGMLHAHPRPSPSLAIAASTLMMDIGSPFQRGRDGPGGWRIVFEPELHLDMHVLVPNLAGWRHEHLPELPETAYFETAPDWVCEIVSPSTARIDRTQKLPIYAEHGVAHCWVVDPIARTLEVFQLSGGLWQLTSAWSDDDKVRAAPFDAIELELGALWAPQKSA